MKLLLSSFGVALLASACATTTTTTAGSSSDLVENGPARCAVTSRGDAGKVVNSR
ncbi:hypothetical protein WME99_47665 [Sorangium sp. So ce136]|uniref:hypothetical protein n=1 Tax=Sorangium sp. So ce136 TaxID=3133284 RepID=UPI003F088DAF